ncbi:ETS homologous factor [Drosophila santomea]|uniref:ETS homologous factor n=1 Tax=Drosophila santomea TaxID=129105 RepID=UPI001954ED44|nr:ETS homologous factor [Drosophila santomea]XP_039483327.1 ETS homologous factor [Drosophila santomea]
MQVESSYPKYAGRVPPLDLTQVNGAQDLWGGTGGVSTSARRHLHHPYQMLDKCRGGVTLINTTSNSSHSASSSSSADNNNNRLMSADDGTTSLLHPMGSDGLPLDPRDWTRADVWKWLINMAVSEGLEVTAELPQKFPMNGKALCLMSLDMYLCRVPVGGKMLYRDFRVRLARAMAL